MKRIAIDMDEVLAQVEPKLRDLYRQETGHTLTREEILGTKIYHLPGTENLRSHLFEQGFFIDLPVMEGAQAAVRELLQDYEIFVVTAAQEFRYSLEEKHRWLEKHFPELHWKNYVFCGDKSIIRADYMIDDHTFNLDTFEGQGLLYTAYHNVHETGYRRVNDWSEVLEFFRKERAKDQATNAEGSTH